MSGTAGEGFGSHPFGEIAKATVAAQERSLELAQAWSDSLRELVTEQAEGGLAALESFAATTQAQLELTRAFLVPLGRQPEAPGSLVRPKAGEMTLLLDRGAASRLATTPE